MNPAYSLEAPRTEVYVGDCRKVLYYGIDARPDLIFADPPFNWDMPYDQWKDEMPRDEYLQFTYEWLDACAFKLADNGALWVNIPDDTAAEIVMHLKAIGLMLINWCIWHYRFGQYTNSRFIASKTHLLYFGRPTPRTWNPDDILVPSDRASKYNDPRTQNTENPGLRVPLDVWYGEGFSRIQGNNRERRPLHPNQLPERLLERIIRACTDPGGLVLDPFLGSGTTCVVARALGRRSIGIEYSPTYAISAFKRIQDGPVRSSKETPHA